MAKEAGAKKVFFASAAPPVRYSNVYGIDIPTRTELIAHQRTEDEIAQVNHLQMTHSIITTYQLIVSTHPINPSNPSSTTLK